MLKELRFVQGAVAKKDFIPAMTHFRIEGGHVRSFNGTIALSSPLAFDIDCTPQAATLVKAISQCGDEVIQLSVTPAGRLKVQAGKFKAFIELIEGDTPHIMPQGERVDFDGEKLMKALKVLFPFTGDDASRTWTNGVLLHDEFAFATNNVSVVQYWLGVKTPVTVNLPKLAVTEMLRIGEAPTYAQIDRDSVTFHFPDERWVRTQLYETSWPDIGRILDVKSNPVAVDERLFEGLDMLQPFADNIGRVFIKDEVMRTHPVGDTGETELGASFDIPGFTPTGIYQMKILALLKGVATHADFSRYPEHTMFFGENLRGALAPMKGF